MFQFEKVAGVVPIFEGDTVPEAENAIVIVNHQQMPDILALMSLGWRKKRLGDFKWFVKDLIKFVPGMGWGLWFLGSVFLKRNWEQDRSGIEARFKRLCDRKVPLWMISFSEGTRITEKKLRKSQAYAKEKGIYVPEYTMIPRTKGFVATVQGLRSHARAVYDITIGYPQGIPSLLPFMDGQTKSFHLHVSRIPIESLPTESEALSQWLKDRFTLKDSLLRDFYARGHFPK